MAIFPNGYGRVCIQSETIDSSIIFANTGSDNVSISKNGNIYHSTDLAKFGNSSIRSTQNSYISIPYNYPDYTLIDFWIYPLSNNGYILYGDSNHYIFLNSSNQLSINWKRALISNINISLNTWQHISIGYNVESEISPTTCVVGGIQTPGQITYYTFNVVFSLNGQLSLSNNNTFDYICGGNNIYGYVTPPSNYNIGYINAYYEEIKFSNSNILSDNFIPYNTPYPAYDGLISGIVKYKTEYANRIIRIYDRNTGELLISTNSDNNGIFYINNLPNTTIYIVCLDDDINETLNPFIYDNIIIG